jgi:UDP-N-acetylmuramyl pentapeptide phosphotransferase/UDP-N-acetylglucosamine-1-phosphate transferase
MSWWMLILVGWGGFLSGATIWLARRGGFGTDEASGVQKVHRHWVPRLGGVPVFLTFVSGCYLGNQLDLLNSYAAPMIVLCSLPAFAVGLLEDITRKAGIGLRLGMTMVAAALSWFFLDGQIRRLDLPLVDHLLQASAVASFVLTLVAVAGVAHAVNIIDGYNGLCGFFALIAFLAIGAVAYLQGDTQLAAAALVAGLSMIGFLFWNYPLGRIFLGDAGAYFIGFLIAEFSILLVTRNPGVSPWCALLIVIYPVWETLFSMFRRALAGGFSQMGQADALHLHHLVFRRLVKRYTHKNSHRGRVARNAMTTPYLLIFVLLSSLPAILFAAQPKVLIAFSLLFAASYVYCYRTIIQLKVPRWIVLRRRNMPSAVATAQPVLPR